MSARISASAPRVNCPISLSSSPTGPSVSSSSSACCAAVAARLRPRLTAALPHRAVQTLLELARAHLGLTDVAGARLLLREIRDILRQRPHLGLLPTQADQLRSQLDMLREATAGAARLTTAELRLLPLLSTHLTFREMSERLYVSPHTVKSQALSLYRKLGVSSRSQAIQRMQQSGLLAS
jgi:LuxR family maltose regulon positive regulatory protein